MVPKLSTVVPPSQQDPVNPIKDQSNGTGQGTPTSVVTTAEDWGTLPGTAGAEAGQSQRKQHEKPPHRIQRRVLQPYLLGQRLEILPEAPPRGSQDLEETTTVYRALCAVGEPHHFKAYRKEVSIEGKQTMALIDTGWDFIVSLKFLLQALADKDAKQSRERAMKQRLVVPSL